MRNAKLFCFGVVIVLVSSAAVAQFLDAPKKASKFQATLVSAFTECAASPGGISTTDNPGAACAAVAADPGCTFGPTGSGKLKVTERSDSSTGIKDIFLVARFRKLLCPELTVLCLEADMPGVTSSGCLSGADCTWADLESYTLGVACCVVQDNGSCTISATLNETLPEALSTARYSIPLDRFSIRRHLETVPAFVPGIAATPGLAGGPKKATNLKGWFVNVYDECLPAGQNTTAPGLLGVLAPGEACDPPVPADSCRLTEDGRGKYSFKGGKGGVAGSGGGGNSGGLQYQMRLTKLDPACEGQVLAFVADFNMTTNDCVGAATCTAEKLTDQLLGTCTVENGKCSVKDNLEAFTMETWITTETNFEIGRVSVLNASGRIMTGGIYLGD